MKVRSLICDDTVCTGSWYDVVEELEGGSIYVWDSSGEYYLLYPDEYEVIEE